MAVIDEESVTLDCPAIVRNERTLVPLRFVAEALGCNVEWDGNNRKVIIRD